jgi:hypothetical protein
MFYTNSLSLANFVGVVVGFLSVCKIRLRSLLLAASLSFKIEMVLLNISGGSLKYWDDSQELAISKHCLFSFPILPD